MSQKQPTVADIFRRAQAIRRENPRMSYKEVKDRLVNEFSGGPFPPVYSVTIPEQDSRAPEEDWTAGLPLVLRGIQQQNWKEIATGIVLSLEQTEGYERQRGAVTDDKEWHNRSVGIDEALEKGVSKWMPEELKSLVDQRAKG